MTDSSQFSCPYCDQELQLPDDAWYYTCHNCGKRLDLKSQFAYLRGLNAFSEGQELMDRISPRRRRNPYNLKDQQAIELFMEAYSSIQVAFHAELAELQRSLGIEMMASMAQEFMKRNMISPLEMNYWRTLMIEKTAQEEYDRLKVQITQVDGSLALFKRWRWRSRQKNLIKALAGLNRQLESLERQIEFTEIPRARNEKWKP